MAKMQHADDEISSEAVIAEVSKLKKRIAKLEAAAAGSEEAARLAKLQKKLKKLQQGVHVHSARDEAGESFKMHSLYLWSWKAAISKRMERSF